MEIKVELKKDTGVLLAQPLVAKEIEDITINFDTKYEMCSAKIVLRNGDVSDVFDFKRNFTIPDKFMFAGRLYIQVELYVAKQIAKRWELFPIDLTLVSGELRVLDYFKHLESELEDIRKDVVELQRAHEIIK